MEQLILWAIIVISGVVSVWSIVYSGAVKKDKRKTFVNDPKIKYWENIYD